MSSRTLDASLLALALFLAACAQAPGDAARQVAAGDAAGELRDPALDEPVEEVPPATAPDAAAALAPRVADFSGFGPAPFGAEAEALQLAWGGPLEGGAQDGADQAAGGCHYLFPQPRPVQGYGTGFMIEGGRFVRVDVDDPAATAPGGGRIGMAGPEIAALYPGRVEQRPHKYVEGASYLRVTREGSDTVLLFETDAGGVVQEWRIGLPPQVDYVEGCS
jgi:hypothetical protein